MINSLLLNNLIPTSSKRKRRIVVYGLVARYGPQSVAKWVDHSPAVCIFSFLSPSISESPKFTNRRNHDSSLQRRVPTTTPFETQTRTERGILRVPVTCDNEEQARRRAKRPKNRRCQSGDQSNERIPRSERQREKIQVWIDRRTARSCPWGVARAR